MARPHSLAKKNLTKSEFKLFSQSFPKELRKIPTARLKKARMRTAELVKKYRASTVKTNDKKRLRMLNFRLRSLEKALDRYVNILHKDQLKKRHAKLSQEKKSLTEQPKMHLSRKDEPRADFLMKEKNKLYAKETKMPREKASAGRKMGKRIAGYMSARTRKGQVAKDRRTSSHE